MSKVIRVFGKADAYDIEFALKGEQWEVSVPPDMVDGVYAVQLTAIDENNVHAYRAGELYMVRGVCCFKIRELPYRAYFRAQEYEVSLHKRKYFIFHDPTLYEIDFEKRYNVRFKKKEPEDSNYKLEFNTGLRTVEVAPHFSVEVATNKMHINPKTDFYVERILKTKIIVRKECLCNGRK